MTVNLKVYRVHTHAHMPLQATEQSACWDISACLTDGDRLTVIDEYNNTRRAMVTNQCVQLYGQERMLVPTGLIFDIPPGYSLRLHPRSGLSIKKGINLINCQGVIDSDYYHETMVALFNNTQEIFEITHGDRIAQCELVPVQLMQVEEIMHQPQPRSNRQGGFGSTGITS